MDVVKRKNSSTLWSKKNAIYLGAGAIFVALIIMASESANSVSIKRGDILVDSVKQGDLDVVIEGYGSLRSDKQQLITSFSRATVKEIILKPEIKKWFQYKNETETKDGNEIKKVKNVKYLG